MTQDSQIKEFQDHARHSLQSGRPDQALALLNQANDLQPDSGSTLMLQAIALSRLNQPAAATDAFREAVAAAPGDGKILFNYAVHLYSYGLRREALAQVDAALEANPDHAGSLNLASRVERDLGMEPRRRQITAPPRIGLDPRMGYESGVVHTIPMLGRYSKAWSGFGWLVAGISVIGTVLLVALIGKMMSGAGSSVFQSDALASPFRAVYLGSLLFTIFFGVSDLLDRRGNWTWLVPLSALSAVGLGWVGLTLYLLSDRRG